MTLSVISAFHLDDRLSAVGSLRSTGIAPRHHYYGPIRHPLVVPSVSREHRLYDGPNSKGFLPGTRRASPVAWCVLVSVLPVTTPPTCPDATASLRQSILPSPPTMRLGHRTLRFTRQPLRSLALRPGDSLAIHKMTLSIGFSSVGFPPGCYPSYGLWLLPRRD